MKHPILDCKIQIEEGIEAHLEQIEDDLTDLKVKLGMAMISGIEKFDMKVLTNYIVDIEILEGYVRRLLA